VALRGERVDLLDRLVGYDTWATTQFLELSRGLSDAQLDQRFDIGDQTLRTTFEYLIFNIEAWAALMAGTPSSWTTPAPIRHWAARSCTS
jgi:hypothetical protein